jgi:hypothetical protein
VGAGKLCKENTDPCPVELEVWLCCQVLSDGKNTMEGCDTKTSFRGVGRNSRKGQMFKLRPGTLARACVPPIQEAEQEDCWSLGF